MTLPPGPRVPRPIQLARWIARPSPFLDASRARYGDVFTLRLAGETPWIILADPELIRTVFTGDPRLLHAGEANHILLPVLGPHSVLLLDEDAHLAQRRLLLPPFHGERLRGSAELMRELAEREVGGWPSREAFPLLPRLQALTLEVILRVVFGLHEPARLARMRAALQAMLAWLTSPRQFFMLAALGPDRVDRLGLVRRALAPVDALIYEEIADRRRGHAGADDVLSLLLDARHEDGAPMSDPELRDELLTLLLAGHETTASGLAWALERLLRHPQAWERLQAGDGAYAEAVVKETLRIRPVLALVLRKLTAPMELGAHALPAGVALAPCIHLLHRRADLYPDPLAFRPERFLEAQPSAYAWIPFGGGVRRCLGASFAQLEMRVVLEAVARHAALAPVRPEGERVVRRAITLTPERGALAVREGPPQDRPATAPLPMSAAASASE